jgi:CRP/FNR family transcriptional regulator, anaerobic regulatory protein
MQHAATTEGKIPLSRRMALHPQGPFIDERAAGCASCVLRPAGLFSRLERDEIDDRFQSVHSGICPANQVIYRAGEPAIAAYTIRFGVIKLLRRAPDGEECIVGLLGRGATIGLETLDAECYASSAVATRDSNLCRITRAVLVDLGRRSPGFHAGLARQWRARALQSEIWASRLQNGSLDQRARWLIGYLREVGRDSADAVRLLRNEDLAELLGVSAETLSRSMAKLKRRGLIRRVGPWTYDCRPFLAESTDAPLPLPHPAALSRSAVCRIL